MHIHENRGGVYNQQIYICVYIMGCTNSFDCACVIYFWSMVDDWSRAMYHHICIPFVDISFKIFSNIAFMMWPFSLLSHQLFSAAFLIVVYQILDRSSLAVKRLVKWCILRHWKCIYMKKGKLLELAYGATNLFEPIMWLKTWNHVTWHEVMWLLWCEYEMSFCA